LALTNSLERLVRHARVSYKNLAFPEVSSPPFLILFINSICNLTCDHCFYWRNLNQRDDLTVDEIFRLARELDRIETLNLSGGEPFLRAEFAEICRFFITNNHVEQIYVPTNGYFTERTLRALESIFEEKSLKLFVCELSIDGMPEYHNRFRGNNKSFQKLMETYDALAEMQNREPRLRIHAISTATNENLDEIKGLTTYLYERCPAMDHHNLAFIRGDRKRPSLLAPDLTSYQQLYDYIRRLWAPREAGRYGSSVEPMLQWAKIKTVQAQTQVVPCRAGILNAVVYANGDVSVCELHKPLGNLRQKSFREIWWSPEADELRRRIASKECWCTTEVFLWPSITYQPVQLAKAAVGAHVWENPRPLSQEEKARVDFKTPTIASAKLPILQNTP
jgi:MoaA/NifB/PqqE/SkfB family radical SAM enzyme